MNIREEFEVWAVTEDGGLTKDDLRWMDGRQTYYWASARMMWDAWKASRAAIEVELPKDCDVQVYSESGITILDSGYSRIQLVRAIESSGVKVKP